MKLRAHIAHSLLGLFGWRLLYQPPPTPKAVLVVYPHTSNWDFILGVLARAECGLPVRFIGKHTLFKWPLGPLMRWLGGTPVDRRQAHGMVGEMQRTFAAHREFYLAMTPEGTRSHTLYWKSGFYHLAQSLQVPVGLAFIDYAHREIGVVTWLNLTGNVQHDMDVMRDHYAMRKGKHPELAGTIRLRDEERVQ